MPIGMPDDDYDFSEQIFDELSSSSRKVEGSPPPSFSNENITDQEEVKTAYFLANALLQLLINKGIIYPHEVQSIIGELYEVYTKKKRGE